MELDGLLFEAETQEDFVYGGNAAANGVGYMTEERWAILIKQLHELDLLDQTFDVKDIFTTEYLPGQK
jgi:NitT/TauT family transport system substrate-binding protein